MSSSARKRAKTAQRREHGGLGVAIASTGLVELRQRFGVLFEGLIVLALDLQFGLEFFDKELQAGDFAAKFLHVHGREVRAWSRGRCVVRCGGCLLREGIGQGARPRRIGWARFGEGGNWNWWRELRGRRHGSDARDRRSYRRRRRSEKAAQRWAACRFF